MPVGEFPVPQVAGDGDGEAPGVVRETPQPPPAAYDEYGVGRGGGQGEQGEQGAKESGQRPIRSHPGQQD
ncbi:hypothetical protein OG898_08745 [Streptomyces sp. NBC_00193]|uniref:hypothetical protein n=1 Tax=Streptomyces sp. NBC_00193 TaxID=2975675 RepID=UPI0022534A16|nr:hypothetical protein [Streptomyces sp. NBC_00193]MCX5296578.1 hypothetical protein [Streptomyces sp. NBC_00193]